LCGHQATQWGNSLDDPVKQMDSYVGNLIRSEIPRIKLDELFKSQNHIGDKVAQELSHKMEQNGISIINTLVTKIDPDESVKDAMNESNASERLKQVAKNNADAKYIEKVREAEGDRDRMRLQGEGISQQRVAILKGYEEGIEDLAKRMGLQPKDVMKFAYEIQRLDVLSQITKGSKTVFTDFGSNKSIFHEVALANEVK